MEVNNALRKELRIKWLSQNLRQPPDFMYLHKKIDYFQKYDIILLVVSPTAKWTAKSVSNSNGVTTQMAMWKRIAIFYEEKYADRF